MYAEERRIHILELLRQNRRVDVADLAGRLSISPETIRRDLREMEAEGLLKRTHGGAIFRNVQDERPETPITLRRQQGCELKARIARRATQFIQNGDVVALDNSSTVFAMLRFIPREYRITIITNSLPVATEVMSREGAEWTCIILGGIVSPHSNSAFGPLTLAALDNFRPNKLFVSCGAIDDAGRLTEGNLNDSELKRALVRCGQSAYLLADASKFGKIGVVNSVDIDAFDYLITNEHIDRKRLELLGEKRVEVVFAEE